MTKLMVAFRNLSTRLKIRLFYTQTVTRMSAPCNIAEAVGSGTDALRNNNVVLHILKVSSYGSSACD
jgi:hypothetical protein